MTANKRASLAAVAAAAAAALSTQCHTSNSPDDPPSGVAAPQGSQGMTPPGSAPLGSPTATTSITGTQLPPVPPKFGGVASETVKDSKPWWAPQVRPPKGAPNVLLVMTDDVGFGAPSTFGGVIPTPALDRVARAGLRYTAFHSTALCSPTRAALITGRNHHSVHTGVITEQSTGFEGYTSVIQKDTATIGQILQANGYATAWFGKDHNTPVWEATPAGPFDRWPTGLGFQHFYGFVGGDASQWSPNLFRDTSAIQPYLGHPGWNLITAMADDAIQYMKGLSEVSPDQPFFVYYVPGGTHAPHNPTPEWIEKFKGKFDMGWNAMRDQIFANQKRLGVIPRNAQLTAWPKDLPTWDSLSPEKKKLYARQMEVYAAYLAYTDHEIGRVIQSVEDMGKLNDTLVIYISGDNGQSPEGTLDGTSNEVAALNGLTIPVAEQMKDYDAWGSDKTYPHFAVGWAWALDTPFQWTKQVASHFGGTRQGMAMAWPGHITDAGGIRNQFSHVIDIAPTILEACGIAPPATFEGIPQRPIEGVSMAYSWDKANADAPTRHGTQYFEMLGSRAIYHDGWVAAAPPLVPSWAIGHPSPPPEAFKWELYDVGNDWTESNDLAQKDPAKLAELQKLFTSEANKYNVFPLNNDFLGMVIAPRPSPTAGRNVFTYSGELANVGWGGAPRVLDQSYAITADIEIPDVGADGVIVTQGGRFGGYGFYLLKSKPVFAWALPTMQTVRWEAPAALSAGRHTIAFDFTYDGGGLGKGGLGVLSVDGKEVDQKRMDQTIPFILQWDEAFNVGIDTGTAVDPADYQVPFRFTGKLAKVTIELKGPPLSQEVEEQKRQVEEQFHKSQ